MHLYLHDNILADLDKLERYPVESQEYKNVYDRVINVGEFQNLK